jgi:hypothetical protein
MRTNGVTTVEQAANGNVAWRRPKARVGRPSTVAKYMPLVLGWLRENPALSGAEILRRIRLTDYTGGKSAIYELVRRLRSTVADAPRSTT